MAKWKDRKRARRARVLLCWAVALLCVTLFLQWAFNKSEGVILPLAQREFEALITDTVYEATRELDLKDAVTPYYNDSGKITYLRTNSTAVNEAVAKILDHIEKTVGDSDVKIAIPIGDIVGDALSLGQGPDILVELNQYRSTRAKAESSFESAGINQTLHRLTLLLEVEAVVLLPGLNPEHIYASLSIPISETVIVGEIPTTYITR